MDSRSLRLTDTNASPAFKRSFWRYVRDEVFALNFYRIHMSYFILVIVVTSLIIWGEGLANDPTEINGTSKLEFIDAIFMTTSAITAAGLNTVNLGDFTGFQQSVLFVLMPIGSVIFVSLSMVAVRRTYFRFKFKDIASRPPRSRRSSRDTQNRSDYDLTDLHRQKSSLSDNVNGNGEESSLPAFNPDRRTIKFKEQDSIDPAHATLGDLTADTYSSHETTQQLSSRQSMNNIQNNGPTPSIYRQRTLSRQESRRQWVVGPQQRRPSVHYEAGLGSFPTPWQSWTVRRIIGWPIQKITSSSRRPSTSGMSYLSFQPEVDNRGRPVNLTEEQMEELGGVEYRALKTLTWFLVGYQLCWYAFGIVCLAPYGYRNSVHQIIDTVQAGDLVPAWWGSFTAVTSFTNCGLQLLDNSFLSFSGYYYILFITMALTLAGNTQFPIFLRLTIWTFSKLIPADSALKESCDFLLEHPRRCFIYLFPAKETWYLFFVQVTIECTEWVIYEVLNIGVAYFQTFSTGENIVNGLFQAIALRTSGAELINLGNIAPGILIAYVVAMYISSLPVIMTLRQTNVYEEMSLSVDRTEGGARGGLGVHLRHQLAYDLWFQMLAWFLLCIIERDNILNNVPGFTPFAILFEVVSAYGTVGLSLGVSNADYSLSGDFAVLGKLVIMVVMLRGRHRGLPLAIDRSIILPSEKMRQMDDIYGEGASVHTTREDGDREERLSIIATRQDDDDERGSSDVDPLDVRVT